MRLLPAILLICALTIPVAVLHLPDVKAEAVMGLSSGTANVGLGVSVNGFGFLPTDRTCALSSPSSPAVIISGACVIQDGSLSGGFIVGNVPPGAYVVQASGGQGDSAQALLQVNGGGQVGLSHTTGQAGMEVSFQGSGFLPTDTTCTISSPSTPNPILPGTGACVIQGEVATGSFTIGNVLPGGYVVQITGNQGDSAQTLITVW